MARVYNQLIHVNLAGEAVTKQYFAAGPLMLKLPEDRGEIKIFSGDYIFYDGDDVVGVVAGPYIDEMREDKDTLLEEEVPTGSHISATIADAAGIALPYEPVVLKQGDTALAEAVSDEKAGVTFNVLPGTYVISLKNPAHGPDIEVVAEPGALPPEEGVGEGEGEGTPVLTRRGGVGSAPRPDNSLPEGRFNVMGKPDPHGDYNSRGELLSLVGGQSLANQGQSPAKGLNPPPNR